MKEIGKDFQGWPINALNLKEILESVGFTEIDKGLFYADKNAQNILEAYPKLLEDDGMGYGVHEQYITDISTDIYEDSIIKEKVFNIFRDENTNSL